MKSKSHTRTFDWIRLDYRLREPTSEPLNPSWPGAGETPGSWRMNHRHVNHIRCLLSLSVAVYVSACVPHLIGTKVGQTQGKCRKIWRQLGRSGCVSDEEASQLSQFFFFFSLRRRDEQKKGESFQSRLRSVNNFNWLRCSMMRGYIFNFWQIVKLT